MILTGDRADVDAVGWQLGRVNYQTWQVEAKEL